MNATIEPPPNNAKRTIRWLNMPKLTISFLEKHEAANCGRAETRPQFLKLKNRKQLTG